MSKSKAPSDLKASIIASSQQLTVAEAAKKFHVAERTIIRYRAEALRDPDLAAEVKEKRIILQRKTEDSIAIAQLLAYETIIAVMNSPEATNQDKLTAFKLLTDRVSADSLAKTMLGLSDNVIENS